MSRRYPQNKLINSLLKVDSIIEQVQEICDNQVGYVVNSLTEIMVPIYSDLQNQNTITNEQLESYILRLANVLYFTITKQEELGIKEDIAKLIRQELYSQVKKNTIGTVAEKEANAVIESQYEEMVQIIYSRAYKQVKVQVDAGYEMLNALKKIMNARLSEMELSKSRYIGGQESDRTRECY